jgi:hypothetical protein
VLQEPQVIRVLLGQQVDQEIQETLEMQVQVERQEIVVIPVM